jgi:hypothetical protein
MGNSSIWSNHINSTNSTVQGFGDKQVAVFIECHCKNLVSFKCGKCCLSIFVRSSFGYLYKVHYMANCYRVSPSAAKDIKVSCCIKLNIHSICKSCKNDCWGLIFGWIYSCNFPDLLYMRRRVIRLDLLCASKGFASSHCFAYLRCYWQSDPMPQHCVSPIGYC